MNRRVCWQVLADFIWVSFLVPPNEAIGQSKLHQLVESKPGHTQHHATHAHMPGYTTTYTNTPSPHTHSYQYTDTHIYIQIHSDTPIHPDTHKQSHTDLHTWPYTQAVTSWHCVFWHNFLSDMIFLFQEVYNWSENVNMAANPCKKLHTILKQVTIMASLG